MTFRCPRCRRWLRCSPQYAGRKMRCPNCKAVLRVVAWLERMLFRSRN